MKKRGISMIVLVITIIMMIILASVIIITLNNTRITDKAKKAAFLDTYNGLKDSLNLKIAEIYLDTKENVETATIDAIEIRTLNPNLSAEEASKFDIQNRQVVLTDNATNQEKSWVSGELAEEENGNLGFNIHFGQTAPTDTNKIWIKMSKPSNISLSIDEVPETLTDGTMCICIVQGDNYELIKDVLTCRISTIYLGDESDIPQQLTYYKYIGSTWVGSDEYISGDIRTLLYLNCDELGANDLSTYNTMPYNVAGITMETNPNYGGSYKYTNGNIHYRNVDNFKFGRNPFTIEMYIKGSGNFLSINYNGSNSSTYTGGVFSFNNNGIKWYCSSNILTYGGTIDTTIWHHIAIVGNTTYIEIFLDGVSIKKQNVSYNMNSNGEICFGANYAGSFGYYERFNGSMDQIAVFNYARYTETFDPETRYE